MSETEKGPQTFWALNVERAPILCKKVTSEPGSGKWINGRAVPASKSGR